MTNRYQVLARRYRPQTFREVVGQQSAVITLKNAIRFSKIAHAYLFCGSRGIGKTTLARLFAKALNCQSLSSELEPCNQCPSCQEITAGQSLDVIEIDGASNRGIDDIRQINETVGYAPSHGRYKIYIIDEVHMLTKEAFNALLKTLEEPPEQVKFFFATTEAHKVLPTIISRCQRFDLARIQESLIVSKLSQIAQDQSFSIEPEAIELIASFSEGSLRDAESLLDQILCFSEKTITVDTVRQTLGLAPKELFTALDEAFATCHLPYAFELVDQLFQTGKDLAHFLEELIKHYRNIVLAICQNRSEKKIYTGPQALYILDLVIQAEAGFQKSSFQRVALESILLRIIRSKHRIPVEVLVRHLTENRDLVDSTLKTQEPQEIKQSQSEAPKPEEAISQTRLEAVPFNPLAAKEPAPPLKPQSHSEASKPQEMFPEPSPVAAKELAPPPKPQSHSEALKPQEMFPEPSPVAVKEPTPSLKPQVAQKPQSHYDTVIRFAAVEFEGIVKN